MKEAVPVKDDSVGAGLDLEDALSVSVYSPTIFFLFLGSLFVFYGNFVQNFLDSYYDFIAQIRFEPGLLSHKWDLLSRNLYFLFFSHSPLWLFLFLGCS